MYCCYDEYRWCNGKWSAPHNPGVCAVENAVFVPTGEEPSMFKITSVHATWDEAMRAHEEKLREWAFSGEAKEGQRVQSVAIDARRVLDDETSSHVDLWNALYSLLATLKP
jgi:hypothetical protein